MTLVCLLAACTGPTAPQGMPATTGPAATLHVAMMSPSYQGLDPAASYDYAQWELLRCCLVRTLMTFRGATGFAGTQPVPDLAADQPSVSADGLTWTFHLRRGIHYAPPLQDVEVTSTDVVRALLRTPSSELTEYLQIIDGYQQFLSGGAASIAGVAAPDPYTLTIRETALDRSLPFVFALPFTAPIPPSPINASSPLGVATGHGVDDIVRYQESKGSDPTATVPLPSNPGYGPFLVATGPYMIQGAEAIDFTATPEAQVAASGFTPSWWSDQPGRAVLVRNPSWDPATDPNRPAYSDQIDISIVPTSDPYPGLISGEVDVVMGEDPSDEQLERYVASDALRDRIRRTSSGGTDFLTINVAQPPFDDVHVRKAFAMALDRPLNIDKTLKAWFVGQGSMTTHLIPDPMEASLLTGWNPDGAPGDHGDLAAAQAEMARSPYARGGRCVGQVCKVLVGTASPDESVDAIRVALANLGITARSTDRSCLDPRQHVALCARLWFGTDFPNAGNLFTPFLGKVDGFDPTLLGASASELRDWGYSAQKVPSITSNYNVCAALPSAQATPCWARLDQLLVTQLGAVIPLYVRDTVRLAGRDVTDYALDQAFSEPSLDAVRAGRSH